MSFPEVGISAVAREWFEERFEAPTKVQAAGWSRIAKGEHSLLIAPTGSGKTLAAFFYFIDRLSQMPESLEPGVRVLYVSPLKALVYDIERNLRAPLVEIQEKAAARGEYFRTPRVAIRTGDTSEKDRRLQRRNPAEILVTTPESLYLLLSSQARETLRSVETVIVDEIHALAPTKRGAHLALSLERLSMLTGKKDPTRIGLSATARPLEEVARFLGGNRPVSIVDTSVRPNLDLTISVPVADMTRPEPEGDQESPTGILSLWPALYPKILEAIRAHKSSIVFVNSRGLCEKLAHQLNELAEENLVQAHHGSIAHSKRVEIEESLKSGELRAIVATSSLELGIDMGAVDLVMLVESPGAVSRGLQRVGRAGHHVGMTSRGLLFPKHRGDLLEAAVVAEGMRSGEVEPIAIPRNPLDVLAQQIVAMASFESLSVDTLFRTVQRAANFKDLSSNVFEGVLDMLAGRYPSTDFAELRPRILWDRSANTIEGRKGSGRLAILSGGTIPDRGLYAVFKGNDGPRIGELDEEMVHETRPGETITLGASTWRVMEITRDRVVVSPAPGEVGRLPFWRGDGPGRPLELGRRLGAYTRKLEELIFADSETSEREGKDEAERWLADGQGLDQWAASNLVEYISSQVEATGSLPTDRAITIERFRDELGDWRICILSPFGSRLHIPWALAIEAQLSRDAGYDIQALASDDGIVVRFADADQPPPVDSLLPDPDEVEDLVISQLSHSALFASHFRENAARALLLPRRRPGARTPLWVQRLRSQNLLSVAQGFPSFPIMLETYRSCLQDVFDLDGLREILSGLRERTVRVDVVETRSASPFARSLVFAYTAAYLYQEDMPAAERRAQALTLDREMLRELLGGEELRDLLDESIIDEVERRLQGVHDERKAKFPDGLVDLLRKIGDLTREEVESRTLEDMASIWIDQLQREGRVVSIQITEEERLIVAEEAALYRDALGVELPAHLPPPFFEPVENAFEQLLMRWARGRGPFLTKDLAARFSLVPDQVETVLASLEARGKLLFGAFHPRGQEPEWCEPEVLRRIRRQTLAKLRDEVAPVEGPILARFLSGWHGLDHPVRGEARLEEVLDQLEGLPLPFSEIEGMILPARVAGFDPRMLDALGALGKWVWLGRGSLGERDGRIALYRRENLARLVEGADLPEEATPLHEQLLSTLSSRGASFSADLWAACDGHPQKEVLDGIWDLVWWGRVTNDTFAPLRALGQRNSPTRRRPGRHAPPPSSAGRWSLVDGLLAFPVEPTERAHARAQVLLERYGVLSRDAMSLENLPYGWAGLYPVLRAMEEAGKVRRGNFVEGLQGAQFALPSVVDRLRGCRSLRDEMSAVVLAATDPANPFGALLDWPSMTSEQARPRRASGARLILVSGQPVLYADRAIRRVWTFDLLEVPSKNEMLACAARALGRPGLRLPKGGIRIEEIDGVAVKASTDAEAFLLAGFRRTYKGLELDRLVDGEEDPESQ